MMMSEDLISQQGHQRWYQKNKYLLSLVGRMQKMPICLLEAYCNCIIDYALTYYQEDTTNKFLLAAGSEKHQALLKSRVKKRWYDKNVFSYKAFNALYLMDDLRRNHVVLALLNTGDLLDVYAQRCTHVNMQPSMATLSHLLLVLVEEGEEEALAQLYRLERLGKLGLVTQLNA